VPGGDIVGGPIFDDAGNKLTLGELEQRYHSLDLLQARLAEIFDERDRVYLDERFARIRLFEAGVADLFDSLRREPTQQDLEAAFSRIVARIFSIANSVEDVSVSRGMIRKYPAEGCVYCHSIPCVCLANRPDAVLGWGREQGQEQWNLRDWQEHLQRLYAQPNSQKGIWFLTTRLAVETNELRAVEDLVSRGEISINDFYSELELELADTLAWTIAPANLVTIDLQKSLLDRFGNGCPVCDNVPCHCGRHNFQPVKLG
jgi:NTP pyrophosphatase (non-canonical NTP hydrolase)